MIQEGSVRVNGISNHREETDHEQKSNELPRGQERVYFMNLICSPKILQDPDDKKQRFTGDFWADKQIKSIRQMTYYVEILINQKKEKKRNSNQAPISKKQLTTQYTLTDSQYQRELQAIKKQYTLDYPIFKKIIEQRKIDQEKIFEEWVRSMKGKNFVGWFMPLREQSSKLRKLAISKPTLNMLGYQAQQFNFQIQKYTDIAVELVNGQAYKTCFLSYFTSFQNYMSSELRNSISFEQCVKKSNYTLHNHMIGKNHLEVKVEMKFSMPNAFTVCYQIFRVMQQSEYQRQNINEYKNTLISKVEKTAFHSLSRITKLPRQMNPENTNKICTYEIIRQPQIWQSNSKDLPSESQYLLSDEK